MKEEMESYGDFLVITDKVISKKIVEQCVHELIESIDEEKLDVQWDTLKVTIKKTDEKHITPFDVLHSENGETGKVCWWKIAIKVCGRRKE